MNEAPDYKQSRREFLRHAGRGFLLGGLALLAGLLWTRRGTRAAAAPAGGMPGAGPRTPALPAPRVSPGDMVWQLDPLKCIQCGRCATTCVLNPSAVKCVHAYAMCGYCNLCFGFFRPGATALNKAAENQMCPTGAIKRTYVEDPYYEYTIDEPLCIGCGKCVKGCGTFGNGSLFLQVRHDRCLNCNECSIARNCPAQAYTRVPASQAYLLKAAAVTGKRKKGGA
jgi:Na+-translocating ferredoxin:NAD+ oxidoreductase subunit B